MSGALQNIEKIKNIFLETQQLYAKHGAAQPLLDHLERADRDFRSIAYESASMSIALASFQAGAFPGDWLAFANGAAAAHRAQVYVGLGWAVAKSGFPFTRAARETDPQLAFRIADGWGYYDGSFRRRQTVTNQQQPAALLRAAKPTYDQGVGRSLWYTEGADIHRTRTSLGAFAPDRQADLWRGVGIAVAYVGGCAEAELRALFELAGNHGIQLARGAALAAKSRTAANTMTDDTSACSRLWFALSNGDVGSWAEWVEKNERELAAMVTLPSGEAQ